MQMNMPVILLLDEDDYVFTKRALEYGVLLCITKPVPIEIAKYLWQLVLREKICEMKKMERLREPMTPKRLHNGVGEEGRANGCSSDNNSLDGNQKSKKKIKSSSTADQDEESSLEHENSVRFRGKFWIEWTQELHEKFVYAIKRLGEGRCYPRAILELMNVPGLTRMQVASHLQKCRRGNWQHPIDRKIKNATPLTISGKSCPAKVKRFGSMPLLDNNPQFFSNVKENDQGQVLIKEDNVSGYYSDGISLAGCHSMLHIEPKDSNGCKPFSDVGVETTNMNSIGPNSGISNEKLVLDAVSVATAANNKASGNEEYFEFSNMDSVIQNLYASEQESIDNEKSGDALDHDQDNEVSVVLDAEKEPDYCEGQKLEE